MRKITILLFAATALFANPLSQIKDIKRNVKALKGLRLSLIEFKENRFLWRMLLVVNPKKPRGAFWFLPHDNENSAFDSAIYAIKKYGGGFLVVVNNDRRYNRGQDPNRNFSYSKTRECRLQLAPSFIYTQKVMEIINRYKAPNMPYLALHNNTNRGGISILKNSRYTKSFLAYPKEIVLQGKGLADEDSLIYIAGTSPTPPRAKIAKLLNAGLNVKYEIVSPQNNDCSMSNFIILNYGENYYNIETQHGKSSVQKEMIDRLMGIINAN